MENRSTTMYTPAKKRTGCNAPMVDDDVLDLISIEFLYYRVRIYETCENYAIILLFITPILPSNCPIFTLSNFKLKIST